MCKQVMGRGDNSVACHADSWMCGGHETCKITCLLDTMVSNPMRYVSTLETAVKEPVVMVYLGISDMKVCRKEFLKYKGRLLARKPKAKASTLVFSSTLLAPCLIVSGQEESLSDERKDCVEMM